MIAKLTRKTFMEIPHITSCLVGDNKLARQNSDFFRVVKSVSLNIRVSLCPFAMLSCSSVGPDICGPGTKKVHVIFTYKGKNLLTKKDIRCKVREFSK